MPTHGGETKRYGLSPLLKRSLISSWEFPLMTSLNLITSPKSWLQMPSPTSTYEFERDTNIRSITHGLFNQRQSPKNGFPNVQSDFFLQRDSVPKAHDSDFTYSFIVDLLQKECLFNIIKYLLTKYSHTSMKVWINEGKDRWWSQLGLKININISTKIYSWS